MGGSTTPTCRPPASPRRSFTNPSGSLGLLLRPAAANEALTVAVSLAQAARAPALEELFFFGEHPGNFAFEVGNPDLESERAFGLDVSLRWRTTRVSGEVTYFRNSISNFIFASPLTEEEFEAREEEFAARFPGREHRATRATARNRLSCSSSSTSAPTASCRASRRTPTCRSRRAWSAELGLDYVRGTLSDGDVPLPRIPPFRVRGGLRYQHNAFQAGGEMVGVRPTRIGSSRPRRRPPATAC